MGQRGAAGQGAGVSWKPCTRTHALHRPLQAAGGRLLSSPAPHPQGAASLSQAPRLEQRLGLSWLQR